MISFQKFSINDNTVSYVKNLNIKQKMLLKEHVLLNLFQFSRNFTLFLKLNKLRIIRRDPHPPLPEVRLDEIRQDFLKRLT